MALTRKFLKALGIEEDKIEEIIEAHSETVNALKEERDGYKSDAEKVKEMTEQLDAVKNQDSFKDKYDALVKEFDSYKTAQNEAKTLANKTEAYRRLLLDAGIPEKRIEAICKVTNIRDLSLSDDGKLVDEDKLIENIKTEWADFIPVIETKGVDTPTPQNNNGGSTFDAMTLAEKMTYANEHPDSAEVTEWLKK